MTFDGVFTYIKDNAEVSTADQDNKIVFALTFKDTTNALTGYLGLSFGLAAGKDAHYFYVTDRALKDAKVKTAVT